MFGQLWNVTSCKKNKLHQIVLQCLANGLCEYQAICWERQSHVCKGHADFTHLPWKKQKKLNQRSLLAGREGSAGLSWGPLFFCAGAAWAPPEAPCSSPSLFQPARVLHVQCQGSARPANPSDKPKHPATGSRGDVGQACPCQRDTEQPLRSHL